MLEQDQENLRPERRNSWLDKPAADKPTADKHGAKQQGDVIYVLRTTQQHHVMLGMIADQKANIILGAFLIFITVTQRMNSTTANFDTPLWILTGFFTVSALFALMVIAPRFRNKLSKSPGNLLFFGTFSQMGQDEYIRQLNDQLLDNKQARELIMADIYQIGQVLDKKYKNLRFSYAALALGILSSVFSFTIIHAIH